ncbi:MAG: ArsR/SmtB family transcription factor [Actinomycetaceae bacterium]
MTDHDGPPDYDLPDTLELDSPAQYKALFDDTRREIVTLLSERACTTTELAAALGRPKGTVGYHLDVLERAGLVRVVRTKQVRALTAKYYGRTARTFLYHSVGEAVGETRRIVARAAAEVEHSPGLVVSALRYARIPEERAEEWAARLGDLVTEFGAQPGDGDTAYGVVFAVYESSRPPLAAEGDGS